MIELMYSKFNSNASTFSSISVRPAEIVIRNVHDHSIRIRMKSVKIRKDFYWNLKWIQNHQMQMIKMKMMINHPINRIL